VVEQGLATSPINRMSTSVGIAAGSLADLLACGSERPRDLLHGDARMGRRGFKSFALRQPGLYHLVGSGACSDLENPREPAMAGLLFIVSRTKPGTYAYMKLVSESERNVILDRREVDRRRIHQRATPERRHGERRRRNIMTDLQKYGWALVHQ
jgi:hypothetical protein